MKLLYVVACLAGVEAASLFSSGPKSDSPFNKRIVSRATPRMTTTKLTYGSLKSVVAAVSSQSNVLRGMVVLV